MCLAVPGKVIEIDKEPEGLKMARVSFNGVEKNICVEWLPEVKVGDYVIVHAGSALSIVNEKEAAETMELFQEWIDSLEKEDNSSDEVHR